ncbi:MAG: sugar transferase [Acidimicrobiia bacterium]
MREFMRELLSANLFVTGIILTIGAIVVFYGSIFLLTWTNLGKKLAFLVTGAAVFGWMAINSLLFVLYAPRGPRPVNIEGLNAFEIRIIPLTYMIVSAIIFIAFVIGLKQYEEIQGRSVT